ncbi:MAG: molybdenum ABC transporter permease, partial [Solirubrobacteraceae bacterium]
MTSSGVPQLLRWLGALLVLYLAYPVGAFIYRVATGSNEGWNVQLPLAVPPLICGILLIYIVGPYTFLGELSGERLTETMIGLVIAQSFVSLPFLVVVARSAFRAVDPALGDVA